MPINDLKWTFEVKWVITCQFENLSQKLNSINKPKFWVEPSNWMQNWILSQKLNLRLKLNFVWKERFMCVIKILTKKFS